MSVRPQRRRNPRLVVNDGDFKPRVWWRTLEDARLAINAAQSSYARKKAVATFAEVARQPLDEIERLREELRLTIKNGVSAAQMIDDGVGVTDEHERDAK